MAEGREQRQNGTSRKFMNQDYLALRIFAKQVKLKQDFLRRKLNSGELAGIKCSNRWYVKKSELMHFFDTD